MSNAKARSTYIGHANIATALDLYGHLMPGNASDAAALLDAFSGEQNRRRWSLVTDDEKRTLLSATASKGSRSIVELRWSPAGLQRITEQLRGEMIDELNQQFQAATASGGRPGQSLLDAWAAQWTALRKALQH
jgi:hypothetical protein